MERGTVRWVAARGLILVLAALGIGAAPPTGPAGRVLNAEGKPVSGAKACLIVGGAEGLCDVTDDEGRYALPASEAVSVRIAATGFLPVNVAAVPQESPVVLEQAASLRVRVVDAASGEGLTESKVTLVYSSGRQLGPFPANQAGLSLPTLPPGEIRVVGAAEGYADGTGATVTLERGRNTEIRLALRRAGDGPKE